MSEYTEQADSFLRLHGMKFRQVYIGDDCPVFCEGTAHIHGHHYRCTFSAKGRGHFSIHFWNSYEDVRKGNVPVAYDVLACIQKTDPGTFENFCGDFGYDVDSRKAEKTYKAVKKEWDKVRRFFNDAELGELQDIS